MQISNDVASNVIFQAIMNGKPFMVARMGSVEQRAIMNSLAYQYNLESTIKANNIFSLIKNAGFFLSDYQKSKHINSEIAHFAQLNLEALGQCDLYAIWDNYGDEYLIRNYLNSDGLVCKLEALEPWYSLDLPWSRALRGKNVLFIHPMVETIRIQSKHWEKIFPGTDILPVFNLKCLKAVQTIGGNLDSRFNDWFDALEWMHMETRKIVFDVAIIGCGACGLPLAGKLKQDGKQVIVMGGATQLFWGIKGKRWADRAFFQNLFNEYWVYPNEADRPKNYELIEQGCYW